MQLFNLDKSFDLYFVFSLERKEKRREKKNNIETKQEGIFSSHHQFNCVYMVELYNIVYRMTSLMNSRS